MAHWAGSIRSYRGLRGWCGGSRRKTDHRAVPRRVVRRRGGPVCGGDQRHGAALRRLFRQPRVPAAPSSRSGGGALLAAVATARGWRTGRTRRWPPACSAAGRLRRVHRHAEVRVPHRRHGRGAGPGLLRGWVRMLTVGLPADVSGELLLTPVLVSWTASFTSAMLALRSRSVLAPAGTPARRLRRRTAVRGEQARSPPRPRPARSAMALAAPAHPGEPDRRPELDGYARTPDGVGADWRCPAPARDRRPDRPGVAAGRHPGAAGRRGRVRRYRSLPARSASTRARLGHRGSTWPTP